MAERHRTNHRPAAQSLAEARGIRGTFSQPAPANTRTVARLALNRTYPGTLPGNDGAVAAYGAERTTPTAAFDPQAVPPAAPEAVELVVPQRSWDNARAGVQ